MHVAVIGAGLAGVSTAYYLYRAGARVTVLDREPGPARETSYANGALLTPSLADPWNAPGVFTDLLRSIGRADAPMLLHLNQIPRLSRWGIRFLRNSTLARFQASYLANVGLAKYSLACLAEIRADAGVDFEFAGRGILKVFEGAAELDRAVRVGHWLKQAGIRHEALDAPALVRMEPMLAEAGERLVGGVFYPDDQVGNARLYCERLVAWLGERGVAFRFSEQALRFEGRKRRLTAVTTPTGELPTDAVVLAAGSYSPVLGKRLKVRVPVVPAKGYSITVPLAGDCPGRPVLDDALHAAVVPLGGNRLRVAGTAEFAGYDVSVQPARIHNLKRLLKRIYPQVDASRADREAWAGLRPMTPDGRPLLGASRWHNLFLNTGHGALGWTLAAASGKVVAELVLGQAPSHDLAAFRADRF